jgi:hypothetical protein
MQLSGCADIDQPTMGYRAQLRLSIQRRFRIAHTLVLGNRSWKANWPPAMADLQVRRVDACPEDHLFGSDAVLDPAWLVGMEACVGAHHLSRKLASLGHDARLMPAKYVRPYSKGQKNDFNDAEAIAEAVQRPTMKFVAIKTAEQLDLQALHRVRERLVSQRTGIINQIRAFMLERGIAVRQGTQGAAHHPCDAQRCPVALHVAVHVGAGGTSNVRSLSARPAWAETLPLMGSWAARRLRNRPPNR